MVDRIPFFVALDTANGREHSFLSTFPNNSDNDFHATMHALAKFESGDGHYTKTRNGKLVVKQGRVTKTGERAFGWAQMMPSNSRSWSAEALKKDPAYKDNPDIANGKGLSTAALKADKTAYDKTVLFQAKKIYDAALAAGKDPEAELASRWLTGKSFTAGQNLKDGNKTTPVTYLAKIQQFKKQTPDGVVANDVSYGDGPVVTEKPSRPGAADVLHDGFTKTHPHRRRGGGNRMARAKPTPHSRIGAANRHTWSSRQQAAFRGHPGMYQPQQQHLSPRPGSRRPHRAEMQGTVMAEADTNSMHVMVPGQPHTPLRGQTPTPHAFG